MDPRTWEKWRGVILSGKSVRAGGRLISRLDQLPEVDPPPHHPLSVGSNPSPADRPRRPLPGVPIFEEV